MGFLSYVFGNEEAILQPALDEAWATELRALVVRNGGNPLNRARENEEKAAFDIRFRATWATQSHIAARFVRGLKGLGVMLGLGLLFAGALFLPGAQAFLPTLFSVFSTFTVNLGFIGLGTFAPLAGLAAFLSTLSTTGLFFASAAVLAATMTTVGTFASWGVELTVNGLQAFSNWAFGTTFGVTAPTNNNAVNANAVNAATSTGVRNMVDAHTATGQPLRSVFGVEPNSNNLNNVRQVLIPNHEDVIQVTLPENALKAKEAEILRQGQQIQTLETDKLNLGYELQQVRDANIQLDGEKKSISNTVTTLTNSLNAKTTEVEELKSVCLRYEQDLQELANRSVYFESQVNQLNQQRQIMERHAHAELSDQDSTYFQKSVQQRQPQPQRSVVRHSVERGGVVREANNPSSVNSLPKASQNKRQQQPSSLFADVEMTKSVTSTSRRPVNGNGRGVEERSDNKLLSSMRNPNMFLAGPTAQQSVKRSAVIVDEIASGDEESTSFNPAPGMRSSVGGGSKI